MKHANDKAKNRGLSTTRRLKVIPHDPVILGLHPLPSVPCGGAPCCLRPVMQPCIWTLALASLAVMPSILLCITKRIIRLGHLCGSAGRVQLQAEVWPTNLEPVACLIKVGCQHHLRVAMWATCDVREGCRAWMRSED